MHQATPQAPYRHPAETFSLIMESIRRVLWTRGHPLAVTPLLMFLYSRLGRLAAHVTRTAARLQAGTLPPPHPAKPKEARNEASSADPRPPKPPKLPNPEKPSFRVPGAFAWLALLFRETASYGSQLEYLLRTDKEMQALLQASPALAREIRRLLHLLGVRPGPEIAHLFPPRAPRKRIPRPKKELWERKIPPRDRPYYRKPTRKLPPGYEWRKWRGQWWDEPIRDGQPPDPTQLKKPA